jgi:hypothetical protein
MQNLLELLSYEYRAKAAKGDSARARARTGWLTWCGRVIQLAGLLLGAAGLNAAFNHDVTHVLAWMVGGVALFLLGRIAILWERDSVT